MDCRHSEARFEATSKHYDPWSKSLSRAAGTPRLFKWSNPANAWGEVNFVDLVAINVIKVHFEQF